MTTDRIIHTHRDIDGAPIAWDVCCDGARLTIHLAELVAPQWLSPVVILHAARQRLAPKRSRRLVRVNWTPAHDAASPHAVAHGVDVVQLAAALPVALGQSRAEFSADEDRRAARKEAARRLGTTAGRLVRWCSRIEDGGNDRTSLARFDELCEELADEYPGAGIDRDDPDTLWALLREPLDSRQPRAMSADVVAQAVALAETAAPVARREAESVPF